MSRFVLSLPMVFIALVALGRNPYSNDKLLPPALPWDGPSQALIVAADDPWITPSEQMGLHDSPSYEDTRAWLEKLVAAQQDLTLIRIGKSHEGREILMVVAARGNGHSATRLQANGKPTLLVQGGIHSGEIDGKDAGMMILRDLMPGRRLAQLLNDVNLLFIPILSVDGHENWSATNRINQRGPVRMGWRTNGRNLNLNRDYAKLETAGVKAVVKVINDWQPHLYLDIHVTDGIDYQYDITYGFLGSFGPSPHSSSWLEDTFKPKVDRGLKDQGHIPGPLIFAVDSSDPQKGIGEWVSSPRFSDGYGASRHLPTILVENHSLKPYRQRVLGTYVLVEESLKVLANQGNRLRKAILKDRSQKPKQVTLSWQAAKEPPQKIPFLGVAYKVRQSTISGTPWIQWLGTPKTMNIPFHRGNQPKQVVQLPRGYWINGNWPEIIEKLLWHGIKLDILEEPKEISASFFKVDQVTLATRPFEGRIRVTDFQVTSLKQTQTLPAGSAWLSCDQPLATLAAHLLEPKAPDSFFQWGYFHEVLQRTEYIESYVVEPLMDKMIQDPKVAQALQEDRTKREDLKEGRPVREWFYRRSPYVDQRWQMLPIGRQE